MVVAIVIVAALFRGCAGGKEDQPGSSFNGVQIGAITYSWRGMPSSAEDVLRYCRETGISSIELMGDVAEAFAGIPPLHAWPEEEARKRQREWRLSVPMEKYMDLWKMFNDSGVQIHIVKFSPAQWSDEEIDYAFNAARAMGAKGVSNEIGHEACIRLGRFAEKHDMFAIFHNHGQPGDPDFNFEEFLAYSPKNMLNFDVGHYFGATGKHPNDIIGKLHHRIFSIHLKDKTARDADPADTNMPWGEGDTPIADILTLIRDNQWPIHCDIELEYEIPEGSDAVKETARCVEYCREILL